MHYFSFFLFVTAPHTWDEKALDYPEDGKYVVWYIIYWYAQCSPFFRHSNQTPLRQMNAFIWMNLACILKSKIFLGCYYQYQYYEEGEQIRTSEPCLNCTCHNQMLMCYLRVCPFIKPVGKNCVVEKRDDQCCPTIMCPQGKSIKPLLNDFFDNCHSACRQDGSH